MCLTMLTPAEIQTSSQRIAPYIHRTPLLCSKTLNAFLDADIHFKFEGHQKVGAFKARGAMNALLSLKEKGQLPKEVVAVSSGNHAQAVAWSARLLGVKATIMLPKNASSVKVAATRAYGAEVVLAESRKEAEAKVLEKSHLSGAFVLPPFDNDDVIAGQGTAAFEAWQDEGGFDAVFAPCGGGGLISGTYLATRFFSESARVYAAEPATANDASRSYASGTIFRFDDSPNTISDGARTPAICERTFAYIKKLDGFYEISEDDIIYWTQWLMHLLKVTVEPTSALAMAAAYRWITEGHRKQKVLIILSGGNLDASTYAQIWKQDFLQNPPSFR